VAEVCLYCGAQNLIVRKMADAARRAGRRAAAADASIRRSVAAARAAAWGALAPPLFWMGILGVLIGLMGTLISWIVELG
jgi:hypothetical protein